MSEQNWRIEGVYEQAQPGTYMLRVKVPGALLSAEQAEAAAGLAEDVASGVVHLTTRMSLELHGVGAANLDPALDRLRAAGLTSRGACGGAVRGVAVSTPQAPGHPRARSLARRVHEHFTGNPEFEGLPKKFKVGVDAGYAGSRHLIQDFGLVLAGEAAGEPLWDVWLAGGLGREPAEALPFAAAVPEAEVLPLLAAVVRLYRERLPKGRRLKHLARDLGHEAFVAEVRRMLPEGSAVPPAPPRARNDRAEPTVRLGAAVARVFAGEVAAASLRTLAALAREFAGGFLALAPDQEALLFLREPHRLAEAEAALGAAGFGPDGERAVTFRVCPGSHECKMGLAPTRDVARALLGAMGQRARGLTWALSGCHNSCAQPQLADVGVIAVRLPKEPEGERAAQFDLLRRTSAGFGEPVLRRASLAETLDAVQALG